ncbi:MAG: LPP20 family lipoprotein [Fibrobacter sp.]|nr:LPP20 family lipoprotein [Fibrobacter sp.]
MRSTLFMGGVALTLLGCSSKEVVQQTPPPPPPPPPVSHELELFNCPDGNLRGSGVAGDYDHALESAVNQIAVQIQSTVTSTSTSQVGSDVSAEGKESITSSYERTSQVSATIKNRQDVHVLQTIARDGVVGVVACMDKNDAAKPYREEYQSARDALVSSMAVLEMTNHPLEKFANYDKMTAAYSRYRSSALVLQSLGSTDNQAEIEENYKKALEGYKEFKSRYHIYFEGSLEAEEGSKIFQELSKKVFLQTVLDSACEIGLVLSLELSDPKCKEGGLGITCTEVVALNGSSCKGETYFTLGATLKGVGRFDEEEAKTKLVGSIEKGDLLADWWKELDRWILK